MKGKGCLGSRAAEARPNRTSHALTPMPAPTPRWRTATQQRLGSILKLAVHILCSVLADCYGCCGVLWCIAVHNDLSTLYMLQWASMHSAEQPCNSKVLPTHQRYQCGRGILQRLLVRSLTAGAVSNQWAARMPRSLPACRPEQRALSMMIHLTQTHW